MGMLLWSNDVTGDEHAPVFEQLKKIGYDFVEIPIFRTAPERFAALGRRLDDLGLERTAVTVLAPEQNLIGAEASTRARGVRHLEAALECSQALGSRLLTGPLYASLGVFSGAAPTRQEWGFAADGLARAAERAAATGVTMAIEYLNRFEVYLTNSVRQTVRLVREVGHPRVRMAYDTFHANIEEKSISTALGECRAELVHVQLSENDRSTPGRGGVNWDETFAALRRIGYRGWLAVEAFGKALPALAAATRIWRPMFSSEERLSRQALAFVKSRWEAAHEPRRTRTGEKQSWASSTST